MKKIKKIAMVSVMVSAMFMNTTYAGGLLGDAINVFAPGVGTALDEAHKNAGNPLDQVGTAYAQAQGVPVSVHCATQQGIFNGPWQPIGAPCNANGFQGFIVP